MHIFLLILIMILVSIIMHYVLSYVDDYFKIKKKVESEEVALYTANKDIETSYGVIIRQGEGFPLPVKIGSREGDKVTITLAREGRCYLGKDSNRARWSEALDKHKAQTRREKVAEKKRIEKPTLEVLSDTEDDYAFEVEE